MRSPIEIGPFHEGINLVDPLSKLTPNELSLGRNWRIGVRGELYKRPGHSLYGSAPAKINGDALVNLVVRYYKSDGTKKLVVSSGGALRYGNDGTGAWSDISVNDAGASMHATNLIDWAVYKNRLYLTDGTKPQRYDGTYDLNAGGVVPAAPTTAEAAGGALNVGGTYKYFTTSVTSDMGEGPKGAEASRTLTAANNRINLSNILAAAAKYEEVSKRIYRTKAGGNQFYLLTTIPSATTTYTDDIADTALGEEFIPTHIPPADSRFVIIGHDERAYWFGRAGVNASIVDVSDIGFPDRVPDTSFFTVANNDGDVCSGGGLVPGGIVFFKKNSMWLMRAFGFGLTNISPREKRGGGVGTTAPFSIVSTPIGLIFLSQRGEIYRFDGTNIEEIGRKVAPEFKGMTQSAMGRVVACYHDYRYIISYDWRGSKGYNWKTLEYDTITGHWEGPHENYDFYTPSYYSVFDSVLDFGELYWGEAKAANGSYVYARTEFTKIDRTSKFISLGITGSKVLANLGDIKSYKVFMHGEFSSDATMTITHIAENGLRTSATLTVPVIVNAGKWGISKWGAAKWGGSTSQTLESSLSEGARSRLPRFEISDGGTATVAKVNVIEALVEALLLK